jgi:hypothetical protein
MGHDDSEEDRDRDAPTPIQRCALAAFGALLGAGCVWAISRGDADASSYVLWAALGAVTGIVAARHLLELVDWIGLLLP